MKTPPLSIKLFEKYKKTEKEIRLIEKKKATYEKQIEKRKVLLTKIWQKRSEMFSIAYREQKERQLAREVKKKQSKLDNDIRQVLGKKETKKKVKVTPLKQTAYKLACLYAKLSRCDEDMTLILFDTGERVNRREAQGGHFYPKGKYPHMALMTTNIYPISARGNRTQGDNIGYERSDAVIRDIGQKTYDFLRETSQDKIEKVKIRDHTYYQEKIDIFVGLIRHECDRLSITFKEATKGILKSGYVNT